MKTQHILIRTTTLLLAAASLAAWSADPVSEREEGFKAAKKTSAIIKEAIERGDHATVGQSARSLASFAARVPELFPPGSQGGFFSAAKGSIWTQFPDFVDKSRAFESEVLELERLASAEPVDRTALLSAYRRLAQTCTACHQPYKRGR